MLFDAPRGRGQLGGSPVFFCAGENTVAIRFRCDCGKRVRANDEWAGKRGICPDCGESVEIPVGVLERAVETVPEPVAATKSSPAATSWNSTTEVEDYIPNCPYSCRNGDVGGPSCYVPCPIHG